MEFIVEKIGMKFNAGRTQRWTGEVIPDWQTWHTMCMCATIKSKELEVEIPLAKWHISAYTLRAEEAREDLNKRAEVAAALLEGIVSEKIKIAYEGDLVREYSANAYCQGVSGNREGTFVETVSRKLVNKIRKKIYDQLGIKKRSNQLIINEYI